MALNLTHDRGLVFRITHIDNLSWLLANGLHCANSAVRDPNFIPIGNRDLIDNRTRRAVPIPPGGMLPDYVPFYLTPKSIMLLNIKTGFNGVVSRPNADIVILCSTCRAMREAGVSMLFTDRHAYTPTAVWTADQAALETMIDWDILRRHDFARDDAYPDKKERYQAEALAYRYVPTAALLGVACATDGAKAIAETRVSEAGAQLQVFTRQNWYF